MVKLLIKADCPEYFSKIPSNSIDLILTGPPFGITYRSNRRVVSAADNAVGFILIEINKTQLRDNKIEGVITN